MSNWNASNYLQRKAQRRALQRPEWFKNPDTGEEFYLRPVDSLMSSVLAGYMPGGLTKIAVEEWKKQGVEGMSDVDGLASELAAKMDPEQIAEADREMATLSQIVQDSCVIPFLSRMKPEDVQFTDEWKADAVRGLKEKDPKFDEATFDPKQLVLHPKDLDGKDSAFLFKWAQGLVGHVPVKGGGTVNMKDVSRFRKPLARGSRAKPDGAQVRETA
jgi:hypothetical protein